MQTLNLKNSTRDPKPETHNITTSVHNPTETSKPKPKKGTLHYPEGTLNLSLKTRTPNPLKSPPPPPLWSGLSELLALPPELGLTQLRRIRLRALPLAFRGLGRFKVSCCFFLGGWGRVCSRACVRGCSVLFATFLVRGPMRLYTAI